MAKTRGSESAPKNLRFLCWEVVSDTIADANYPLLGKRPQRQQLLAKSSCAAENGRNPSLRSNPPLRAFEALRGGSLCEVALVRVQD